jgi:hypothetical protein
MVGRLQEMVQGNDAMDNNLHFVVSLGECEAKCVCVFDIKVQAESAGDSQFDKGRGVVGL